MTQFSRRARWLNTLFPQSVAPASADPAVRSDDVSLVQSYDGGGWGISEAVFPAEQDIVADGPVILTQPEVSIRDFLTLIGIATRSRLFELDENHYARVYAVTRRGIAGTGGDNVHLTISSRSNTGIVNHEPIVTPPENTIATFTLAVPLGFGSLGAGGNNTGPYFCGSGPLVVPPNMMLNLQVLGANATTQYRMSLCMMVLPVGASVQV